MNVDRRMILAIASVGVAMSVTGCASWSDASAQWREAVVRQVYSTDQPVSDVDKHCIEQRTQSSGKEVAVVKYRIGRSPYYQALFVDPQQFHPGDRVVVNAVLCEIKPP